jgi:glycosyltransferase involved in cell wall biosynthesis
VPSDDHAPAWTHTLPLVSCVVAVRDEQMRLRACLESLRRVDYPRTEIIVADDGSRDGSVGVAREMGAVVVEAGGRGPAAARNLAVAVSKGEVIAFTDADCTVPVNWLRPLVHALAGARIASAGGGQRQVFPEGTDDADNAAITAFFDLTSAIADYTRVDARAGEVAHNASCNVAYRRDAFEAVGGFSEGLFPGEDIDLDFRLSRIGLRAWFVPGITVLHHRPGGMRWFVSMMRRYGHAEGAFVRTHGPWRPVDYVPFALAAFALAQALAFGRRTWVVPVLIDGALMTAAIAALARVPRELRLGVVRCALVAGTQWNLGYLAGLRTGPPARPADRR